jgi:hypothetical protein
MIGNIAKKEGLIGHFCNRAKKTPTSKGERCRSKKHTMRKLHSTNIELLL